MKNTRKCLTPGCKHAGGTRGACPSCYSVARRAVAAGTHTWDSLIKAGLVLPVVRTPSPLRDIIHRAAKKKES
jgi:hypothetical protein